MPVLPISYLFHECFNNLSEYFVFHMFCKQTGCIFASYTKRKSFVFQDMIKNGNGTVCFCGVLEIYYTLCGLLIAEHDVIKEN